MNRQSQSIIMVLAFVGGGVFGCMSEDIVDDAYTCEDLIQEEREKVLSKCASSFDGCLIRLEEQLAAKDAWIESILEDVEAEVMTRLGCFLTGLEWDCSSSQICK